MCCGAARRGLRVLLQFRIFNHFCRTICLKIHRTDLRQIFRVGIIIIIIFLKPTSTKPQAEKLG